MPFTRPYGAAYWQGLSAAKSAILSASIDGEFDAIYDILNNQSTWTQNISEWALEGVTPTYVAGTQFTVDGDLTGTYMARRAIRANLNGSFVYSFIVSSSYAAGPNKTTVTLYASVLTNQLTEIYYGLIGDTHTTLSLPRDVKHLAAVTKATAASPYTVALHDDMILANCDTGSIVFNLPAAANLAGVEKVFKRLDASTTYTVTITPNGTDQIDGVNASILLEGQYNWVKLKAGDDSKWYVVAMGYDPYVKKTANYTVAIADSMLALDAAAADVYATLPTAVGKRGKAFLLYRHDDGTSAYMAGVKTTGSETINGIDYSATGLKLYAQFDFVVVVSDGAQWVLKAKNFNYVKEITSSDTPYTIEPHVDKLIVTCDAACTVRLPDPSKRFSAKKVDIVFRPKWTAESESLTYISGTQFKFTGDKTATYVEGVGIRANLSGTNVYSRVVSSSFGGGETTVTIADSVLTASLSEAYYQTFVNATIDPQTYELDDTIEDVTVEGSGGMSIISDAASWRIGNCDVPLSAAAVEYTSAGTSYIAVPPKYNCMRITLLGGGGGGGQGYDATNTSGGGGGAGGFGVAYLKDVSGTYTLVVGAGGADSTDGDDSTLAKGGITLLKASGGSQGAVGFDGGAAGAAGTFTVPAFTLNASSVKSLALHAGTVTAATAGAVGGGSAGGNGGETNEFQGKGAGSTGVGGAASDYGAGGGGGGESSSRAGGAGYNGYAKVTLYRR